MDALSKLPVSLTTRMMDADLDGTITGCPGIDKHATGLAGTFTSMVSDLANGDSTSVIRYINRGSIVRDVESLLGRSLDKSTRSMVGLTCPAHIEDLQLSRACSIARELQAIRHTARRTCQMYQAHGTGSKELHARLNAHINDALGILGTWEEYQELDLDEEDTFQTW